MKIGWAAAVLAFVAIGLSASDRNSEINAFVEAEISESAAPGLAYSVVENGKSTSRGFGELEKGSGEAVTARTTFPIGSVTKSFTALAIMQLLEAGKLGLDDDISRHLSAFDASPANGVTIRQLLNHTSGYSTVQGNSQHGNSGASQLGLTEYAGQLAQLAPIHQPGKVWEYSNANYQILGAVIEKVSGTSYSEYIEERIFEPLGMTNSKVVIGPDPAGMAARHRPWFGSVRPYTAGDSYAINASAGGIVSSAEDMSRYLAMWLNGSDDVVTAETKAIMTTSSGPASPRYGLGWSLNPQQGTVYHTGLVSGAEALASFNPSESKGVVVMVNANGGLGFADTWFLIGGTSARAMGRSHEDDGSRLGPKVAYLSIAILPPLFVLLTFASWRGRTNLQAKRNSIGGKLSLWIPLFAMAGLAWAAIALLPRAFGGTIGTLQLYQPDFAWCLLATAVLAPAWALLRILIAYSPNRRSDFRR